ncbi:hypothetical protein V8F63_02965 [Brevundimonas sp. LF-1]|uniref:hypothetical protein n=1 Tax=Brevundimonas sp. LF-1 TaxID=3126100 RepID=UPI0030E1D92F
MAQLAGGRDPQTVGEAVAREPGLLPQLAGVSVETRGCVDLDRGTEGRLRLSRERQAAVGQGGGVLEPDRLAAARDDGAVGFHLRQGGNGHGDDCRRPDRQSCPCHAPHQRSLPTR